MRKFLLLTFMCVLGLFAVNAQGNLTIVEMGADQNPDVGSNYYLPVFDYSPYSISQQIYTAEEFGDNMGAIMTVGFKLGNTTYVQTRTYEVYLKSTELSEFNGTSYISLTADDKVFDGDVEISGEMDSWFTITLDKSFNYTGGNVVLAVYDKTGLTGSYHYFYKYAATGRSLYSKGNTIAVLANGLDTIYPSENKKLANKILEKNGLIISEYPIGTKPIKQNFPARNRIISGISKAVLVVEAKLKSGTMITVDFALEQGKDVFVIPR